MIERPKQPRLLTIGAFARATGVPIETLRTWERRYGFPSAERTPTGHRRYTLQMVARVRLAQAALKLGHRPAVALAASELQLRALLGETAAQPSATGDVDDALIARWIELIRSFDGRALDRELRLSMAAVGTAGFLTNRVGPLIREIGDRWCSGELGVRHEHYASERLQEFFVQHWQPLSDSANGPYAICATPVGERHSLGLQMATLTLALNNVRIVYLGADVPAHEVVLSVEQHAASAVVLSAASGVAREPLLAECSEIRAALGAEFPIIAGGGGFESAPSQVTYLAGLRELDDWARAFAHART